MPSRKTKKVVLLSFFFFGGESAGLREDIFFFLHGVGARLIANPMAFLATACASGDKLQELDSGVALFLGLGIEGDVT